MLDLNQQKSAFGKTNYSSRVGAVAAQPYVELRKVEAINSVTPLMIKFNKQVQAMDSLVTLITSVKNMYKNSKVVLYMMENEMQELVFGI